MSAGKHRERSQSGRMLRNGLLQNSEVLLFRQVASCCARGVGPIRDRLCAMAWEAKNGRFSPFSEIGPRQGMNASPEFPRRESVDEWAAPD